MEQVTVIGAGLAGLIAAIESAERGAAVQLLEARSRIGGRAQSTPRPCVANLGPHVLYTGGSLWDWLVDTTSTTNTPDTYAIRLRWKGEMRDSVPAEILGAIAALDADARMTAHSASGPASGVTTPSPTPSLAWPGT